MARCAIAVAGDVSCEPDVITAFATARDAFDGLDLLVNNAGLEKPFSKGGAKLFGQSIAHELAPHGIRVVSVAPGAIATPLNADVLADRHKRAEVEEEIPLGRWGEVSDVARAVAWVASGEAGYVVGWTLFVDGRMTLYPKFV